jgi:hypothetical protein
MDECVIGAGVLSPIAATFAIIAAASRIPR